MLASRGKNQLILKQLQTKLKIYHHLVYFNIFCFLKTHRYKKLQINVKFCAKYTVFRKKTSTLFSCITVSGGVSGSATGELGHYGSHPRPQVADRG